MSKLKRKDIIPGTVLKVKANKTLSMDAHLILFGKSWEQEYECYYCDILQNCEV